MPFGGRLRQSSYDAKDDSKRYSTDIIVTELAIKDKDAKTAF